MLQSRGGSKVYRQPAHSIRVVYIYRKVNSAVLPVLIWGSETFFRNPACEGSVAQLKGLEHAGQQALIADIKISSTFVCSLDCVLQPRNLLFADGN